MRETLVKEECLAKEVVRDHAEADAAGRLGALEEETEGEGGRVILEEGDDTVHELEHLFAFFGPIHAFGLADTLQFGRESEDFKGEWDECVDEASGGGGGRGDWMR